MSDSPSQRHDACPACGALVDHAALVCLNCGVPSRVPERIPRPMPFSGRLLVAVTLTALLLVTLWTLGPDPSLTRLHFRATSIVDDLRR